MNEAELPDSNFDAQVPLMSRESLSETAIGASMMSSSEGRAMISIQDTDSVLNPDVPTVMQSVQEEKTTRLEEPPSPVLYKVHYYNEEGNFIFSKESKEPAAVQNMLPTLKKAAVEVITDVRIIGPYKFTAADEQEPQYAVSIIRNSLKINSPAIITALQSVIEYFPERSFSEDSSFVEEPFSALILHEEELGAYRDLLHPEKIKLEKECCPRNANAYEHLGILRDLLIERLGREVEAERQRHTRGVATFEMLWLLFKPGIDVYHDPNSDGIYNAYVVRSVSGGVYEGRISPLEIEVWNIDYDGNRMGRCCSTILQPVFDGEKDITSLVAYPCRFWKEKETLKDEEKQITLKDKLIERGKMFFKLAQGQCMDYDGLVQKWPTKHFKGLTMVDTEVYFAEVDPTKRPDLGKVGDTPTTGISDCLCHVCLKSNRRGIGRKTSKYSAYDEIDLETTKHLTDHQYFLCPPSVYAYLFKNRDWELLNIYCFSDPTFDTAMIDTLVMEDGRRRLIKALAKNYQNETNQCSQPAHKPWAADFVAGKGEGKIFLLHGKPGVGKTYTAECMAAYTKRPLLSLAISDIGIEPSEAEKNLNRYFARAKRWNAILLIDEADIYMERRENADSSRNSLVSGFMRAIGDCQSILFLTTNRIGSFDDAFVSRIHISLYYRDFTEEDRRKVWTNFFNKLAKDRKNAMHVPVETILYTTGPEVASLKWNGREIRNAFQTAVALADYDNDKNEDGKIILHEKHIQQIVNMSQEFKQYLRELHRGDEAKRADRQRIRYDEFGQKS